MPPEVPIFNPGADLDAYYGRLIGFNRKLVANNIATQWLVKNRNKK